MSENRNPAQLELSEQEMRQLGYRVVDILVRHFADGRSEPVGAKGTPGDLIARFADGPPEGPTDMRQLISRLENDDFPNNIHVDHPRFSAVERAVRVIGFAREQFRKIPSDDRFRLPLDRLREAIQSDKQAGLRPFCIIANAGTTNTGAVDPLPELGDLCAAEEMWLHADGAYGAATMICERGRQKLSGLERVDSLSLDPHKWLFQPFECGCVLVRDAAGLKSAFQLMPEYMRDVHRNTEETNPADYGVQLSRGFRALKVWLSINTFGIAAFRDAVTRGFELAEFAENELRRRRNCEIQIGRAHV